jgi:hypothetical protein
VGFPFPSRPPTLIGSDLWSEIATRCGNMPGGRRLCCSAPRASGRTRSCVRPASPRPASGAGTVRRRRRGWASTRQDAALVHPEARSFDRRGRRRADHGSAAERGNALDRRGTGAAMAEAADLSVSSVQRIWRAHGLQPHRVRQFELSKDPTRRHKRAVLVARRMGENGESGRSAGPRGTPVSQTIARSLNPTPFRGVHIPHT